jgi:hypothetical protein
MYVRGALVTLGSVKAADMALDACYGSGRASVWPGTIYAHLFAGDPTLGAAEITGGGYAPISIPNDSTHWPNAMGGLKTNGVTEQFPVSTGPWSAPATFFWLSDQAAQLPAPMAPSVSTHGTAGVTNNQYVITALNADGETTASGIGVITTANAVLNGSNYNVISWSAVASSTGYNVYKLVGSVFVFLATTGSTTYNDQGASTTAQTPPVSNTTMTLLDGGPLSVPIRVLASGTVVSFPPSSIVIGD